MATEKLNVKQVKSLTTKGMYNDGGGLNLRITSTGNKSWIYRYMINHKSRNAGLGKYPDISLSAARAAAKVMRSQVAAGIDPLDSKAESKTTAIKAAAAEQTKAERTFKWCAEQYIKVQEPEWKNPKHRQQWTNTLVMYAFPSIGSTPITDIDTNAVLSVLEPIWLTKNETASRVRGRLERILSWAKVKGYRSEQNPALWRGHLDHLLPKPSKVQTVKHFTALPYKDISAFVTQLQKQSGMASKALEFSIMTACRTQEVLGCRWDEIDFEGAIWTIPAGRMKMGKEHKVPLPTSVTHLLSSLPKTCDFVFPSQKHKCLTNMAMPKCIKRMKYDCTVHGMRSCFRDWAAEETNFPNQVCEMALAHTIGNAAEAAYRRGELLNKRRKLLEEWSEYIKV